LFSLREQVLILLLDQRLGGNGDNKAEQNSDSELHDEQVNKKRLAMVCGVGPPTQHRENTVGSYRAGGLELVFLKKCE